MRTRYTQRILSLLAGTFKHERTHSRMIFPSKFYKDKSVLIVDDCEPIRSAVKAMLQKIGFNQIGSANNGLIAVQKCEDSVFDFLLVDFNLGEGKDGYQLFEELKYKDLLSPGCCFIMMSAESRRQIVHGIIELQPDDYLLKPFTYKGLEKRCGRTYQKKSALSKVYEAIFEENPAKAIIACENTSRATPEYAAFALRLKGELLIKTRRYEDAQVMYQSILSTRELPWAVLGNCIARIKMGDYKDTEIILKQLAELAETKVEALDWLGRLYIQREQIKPAQKMLAEAARISPRNIHRQRALANLAIINGEIEEAVRAFAKIISSSRFSVYDTPENYLNFARILVDLCKDSNKLDAAKQIGKALDVLNSVGKRFYSEVYKPQELVIQARINASKGNMEEAREQLSACEKLKVSELTADQCLDRAKAYFSTGNLSKSDEYMTQLKQLTDNDDLVSSTIKVLVDKEKENHEQLREKIRILNNEGLTAYQNGIYGKAMDSFKEAFIYMPSNASLALNLVQSITKTGANDSDSKRLCRRCVELIDKSELSESNTRRYLTIRDDLYEFM
jgi:DNA-binding NarL/FixJ family response regulator/Tfp pilus assembly protein PilF